MVNLKIVGMALTTIGAITAAATGTYCLVKKIKEKKAAESETMRLNAPDSVTNDSKAELMKSNLEEKDQAGNDANDVRIHLDDVPGNKLTAE